MLLIPAIDIKDNFCVRLIKGNMNKSTVFAENPILLVNKLINAGADRLHIVDLNGALNGSPKNLFIIKSIINFVNNRIPIQLGGGIRSLDVIEYYFNLGISYLILSTKAVTDIDFFYNICNKFPGKIILALDIKNNRLAINGWVNYHKVGLIKFLKNLVNFNVESIILTDTSRDGTLSGLNFSLFSKLTKFFSTKPIIISGGLKSLTDIRTLFNLQNKGLSGLICGKSIYTGSLNFFNIQNKIKDLNKIYSLNKFNE